MYRSRCHCAVSNAAVLGRLGIYNFRGLFVRVFWFVVSMAAITGVTRAQSVGYILNSADGTVTIAGSAPNPLQGVLADSTLETVAVCGRPSNSAVTPDLNFVYVTCSADNSLWTIDVRRIGEGIATAQPIAGLQLNAPSGVAISTLTTGSSAGKTLAYIVNSSTNTISVIDTSTNRLYDGPIALGPPPGLSTGTPFAGLVAIAPDATKVFATINNPTPQLWMIDTTAMHETAIQIQTQNNGIPTAATDSLYLSVQEGSLGSDYYVLLASSVPINLQSTPSVYLLDIVPAVAPGAPGSPSNALVTVAQLGSSQPTHIVSLLTGGGRFLESTQNTGPPFLTAYTVDQTSLWVVNFNCTAADGTALRPCTVANATPTQVTGGTLLSAAPNGLAITGVPFSDFDGGPARENIYITDGQPTGIVQVLADVSFSSPGSTENSAITAGNGAQSPVFSPLAPKSAPVVFFTGTPPPLVVRVNDPVNALGISFVNPQNKATVSLSFGTNNAQLCNGLADPCRSPVDEAPEAGVGGSTMFPQSGVYTVTLTGTGNAGSLPTGQATRTIYVGANCDFTAANGTPPPSSVAVNQAMTIHLSCIAPMGDSITAVLDWGDGLPTSSLSVTAGGDSTAPFVFSHAYAAPRSYNLTMSLKDVSDGSTGSVTGGGGTVTVNALTVSVSPPAISVQIPSHSVSFAAAVQFDSSVSGVTWALSGSDCSGTTCGTLSNVTPISVTYTAPPAAPASGMVSLTATSTALISYPNPNKSFSVPIKLTALPPPNCTLSAPSSGQTGVSIKADVTCAAPAGDSLTATLNWGDGTTAATNSATVGSNGSAGFSSFTHAYATASNPSYSISLNVTDSTTGLAGSVTPPSIAITVFQAPTLGPPAAMSSVRIVPGQSVTVPFNFSAGATNGGTSFNTIACAVAPAGPSCAVSPSTVILDSTGKGIVQLTITTVGPETAATVLRGQKFGWLSSSLIALPGLGLVFIGLGASTPKSKRLPGVLCLFLLVGLAISGAGCGSTTQRSNLACAACTPAGSYTVTVLATSQKPILQASGTVSVVVVNH